MDHVLYAVFMSREITGNIVAGLLHFSGKIVMLLL